MRGERQERTISCESLFSSHLISSTLISLPSPLLPSFPFLSPLAPILFSPLLLPRFPFFLSHISPAPSYLSTLSSLLARLPSPLPHPAFSPCSTLECLSALTLSRWRGGEERHQLTSLSRSTSFLITVFCIIYVHSWYILGVLWVYSCVFGRMQGYTLQSTLGVFWCDPKILPPKRERRCIQAYSIYILVHSGLFQQHT